MTIKNFNDLIFNDHANNPNGVQAKLDLGNNTQISVVSMKDKETEFGGLYGSVKAGTYEVAVFHNESMVPLSPWGARWRGPGLGIERRARTNKK